MHPPHFADCSFPSPSNVLDVGHNQLCCNYSSQSPQLPRVFINGSFAGTLETHVHEACNVVFCVSLLKEHNGLEIAVQYGTSDVGRWNATIIFRELQIKCLLEFIVVNISFIFSFTVAVQRRIDQQVGVHEIVGISSVCTLLLFAD